MAKWNWQDWLVYGWAIVGGSACVLGLVVLSIGAFQEMFPGFGDWYRILRAHQHWTVFQAIRWALWLAR
jgi:hypothetical protein